MELLNRTIDRRFTEIVLRHILQYVAGYHGSIVEGRWVIETPFRKLPWEAIIGPNFQAKLLRVVTACQELKRMLTATDVAEFGGAREIGGILSGIDDTQAAKAWSLERLTEMPLPIRKGIDKAALRAGGFLNALRRSRPRAGVHRTRPSRFLGTTG